MNVLDNVKEADQDRTVNSFKMMQLRPIIQLPINATTGEQDSVRQLARELNGKDFELNCTVEEFAAFKNSQAESVAEFRFTSWHVAGFVGLPCDELMESLVHAAHAIEIERISFAPINLTESGSRLTYAGAMNDLYRSLKRLMPIAERWGVTPCVQPAKGQFLTSPVELREFITEINSPKLKIDLPIDLPPSVPVWTDWFTTLTPMIRSVRIPGKSLAETEAISAEIAKLCTPRVFDGEVVVCPK